MLVTPGNLKSRKRVKSVYNLGKTEKLKTGGKKLKIIALRWWGGEATFKIFTPVSCIRGEKNKSSILMLRAKWEGIGFHF